MPTPPNPDVDLCSLQDAKDWLVITNSSNDDLLQRLVTAGSAGITNLLNTTVLEADFTEDRTGTGSASLFLRNVPVTKVGGVSILGKPVPRSADWGMPGFYWDEDAVHLRGGLTFPRTPALAVRVRYTAGYDVVPDDLRDVVVAWVGKRFRERDRIGHRSKSIGGETVAFDLSMLDDAHMRVLNAYKRVTLV